MRVYLRINKGQTTLEYAILSVVIIAALATMQMYMKRGVGDRLKTASDDIGDQYSAGNTNVIVAEKTGSREAQTFGLSGQGVQNTVALINASTNRVMKSSIINTDQEFWGQ